MNYFKRHKIFKLSAQALILASALCVLFGSGVHFHSVLDHIFDHGDIHIDLHAHSNTDQKSDSFDTPSIADKEHEVSTIYLNGILSHTKKITTKIESIFNLTAALINNKSGFNLGNLTLLDLPPPDIIYAQDVHLSLSLRAPPLA